MNEELITYETYVLAKEKGFEFVQEFVEPFLVEKVGNRLYIDKLPESKEMLPTQSLLQKWLRDVHNIQFHVDYNDQHKMYALHFQNPIIRSNNLLREPYETHEQALEAGLVKALKLIK
jgi:hypothetical protein